MINIKIDGVDIEKLLTEKDQEIEQLEARVKILEDVLIKNNDRLDIYRDSLDKLKSQVIEMGNEGARERNSFWDFLRGRKKPDTRLKETVIELEK